VREEEISYSLTQARAFPSQASRPFEVPARHGRQARSTQLQLACGQLTLLPPRHEPRAGQDPMTVWVIRVWEEQAPEGEEPLEWILVTSVPTTTLAQAWERVDWYRCRWLVEDYHQCLKSGCRIEERQLQTVDGLMRLLGLLSPLAVRLLQVRALAREDPERPAHEVIEPLMLAVLAQRSGHSPATLTIGTFWTEVARLGGYLARSHDGPPGWRTIWKGWLSLQTLLEGAHLALHLRL
jgi:Transposase DDE domain